MLYSKVNFGLRDGQRIDEEYRPGIAESLKLGFLAGWEESPYRTAERAMASPMFDEFPDMADQDVIEHAVEWGRQKTPGLPLDEQERMIAGAGLAGKVKPDPVYDADTLTGILMARQEKGETAWMLERGGAGSAVAAFAGELAGGSVDPISLASMFVPVVGEERKLALLQKAGSGLKRALARARIGMVEGAAGAALTETITNPAASLSQTEYGPLRSLMNIAGGALAGSALHPAAGLASELKWRNAWIKPWDGIDPSGDSRALVSKHAAAISQARRLADPSLSIEKADQEGLANALAFDLFLRNRAWREKRSLTEVYNDWQVDYRSGELTFTGAGRNAGTVRRSEPGRPGQLHAEPQESAASSSARPAEVGQEIPAASQKASASPAHSGPGQNAPGQAGNPRPGQKATGPADSASPAPAAGAPQNADILETVRAATQDLAEARQSLADFTERQKAVVEFFADSDGRSASHELLHVMRRQLEESAKGEHATPKTRELWAQVEEACGVEPGGAWSREAEEKFADAAGRYFWKGKIADKRLEPAVAEIRRGLAEVWMDAEAAGAPSSVALEKALAPIWESNLADHGRQFRAALMSHLESRPEDAWQNAPPLGLADPVAEFGGLNVEDGVAITRASQDLDKTLESHSRKLDALESQGVDPGLIKQLKEEFAGTDKWLRRQQAEAEALDIYAACLLGA